MRTLSISMLLMVLCSSLFAQQRSHPPLLLTLDHNNDFVITGVGQPVAAISFTAPNEGTFEAAPGSDIHRDPETGELTGSAPAPFSFLVGGNASSTGVTYSAPLGETVNVNGSFPLLFGPTDIGLLSEISVEIGYDDFKPYDNPFGFICETCSYPDATVTPDGGIEVTNINDPIIRISVFDNDGGLLEVTEAPAGATIVKSTATRLILENLDGFQPAELEDLDFLAGVSSSGNAFVKFDLDTGDSFGPMPMAAAVPEPSSAIPMVAGLLGLLLVRRRRIA